MCPKRLGKNELEDIPEALRQSFGELTLVTTLVLTESRKLARADIHKVMAELNENRVLSADAAGKVPP